MSKRGSLEVFILVLVVAVAFSGLFLTLRSPRAQAADVQVPYTGGFVIPAAKEYGGAVRGVAAPGTRAFPAGRAYELPEQSCFLCSCLEQGITAADQGVAARVCADNCGGAITGVLPGACQ